MLLAPKVLPRILSQAQSGGVKAILCVPYAARDTRHARLAGLSVRAQTSKADAAAAAERH